MKQITYISMFVFLVACGPNGSIKSAVLDSLIDPDSAKFGNIIISKQGTIACVEVNAKNSFGGYTGEKSLIVRKIGGRWEAGSYASPSPCERDFINYLESSSASSGDSENPALKAAEEAASAAAGEAPAQ